MEKSYEGTIIAFEGLDCSFKETNYKEFTRRLNIIRGDQYPIYKESFPRYKSDWSFGIKKWLDGSLNRDHLKANPRILNSMYTMDRLAYWYEFNGYMCNFDALKYKCYFVFDRYDSSKIYNTLDGGMPTLEDFTFDRDVAGIPTPDITVVMRMREFSMLEELLKMKECKDRNETDTEYLKKTWDRLEYAIEQNLFQKAGSKLVIAECLRKDGSIKTKKELADQIWHDVYGLLEY